jgi:glyoxylase-like metal-dependent hydrolase (beta-lactamase superfamily II)
MTSLGLPRADARTAPAYKIGAAKMLVVSDGQMAVPPDRLVAKAPADAGAAMLKRLDAAAGTAFAINVPLFEIGGKRILIDAGAGGNWVPTAGKLADNLASAKIMLDTIDLVVLTHAHPDHLWGLVDELDDSLRYPKARYVIAEAEHAFWSGSQAPATKGVNEGTIAAARRIFKLIEGKLDRVKAGAEIAPGVALIGAAGHTPGQCAVLVKSGGDTALVTADTIFHAVVSVEHPEWQPAQDMDGDMAAASRRRILDIAATEKALVSAYHVRTGPGRIERAGNGYVWKAA